jgi:hypothetical protein
MFHRAELRASDDDVGEGHGHLVANRVNPLGADGGAARDEGHAPLAALGHDADDRRGAIAVDAHQVSG